MSPARDRLEATVRGTRAHLVGRASAAAGLWLGVAVGLVLAVAWLATGPEGWRQGSDIPFALDVALLLLAAGLVLGVRSGARRWFAEAPLSRAMEAAAGLRPGSVRGALELGRSTPDGVSRSLVGRATAEAAYALGAASPELAGALGVTVGRWVRRGAGALAAVTVVLASLAAVSPARTARAWSGLWTPLRIMADPAFAPLTLTPGDVEVARGSDVEVRLEAPGRATAVLVWQATGDIVTTDTLELVGGVGVKAFRALAATVEYRARTPDGASTKTYRLVPVDPLFVSDVTVEVAYPPHTGLPPEEYRGNVPSLRLPEGTRLLVQGSAGKDLSEAGLVDGAGAPIVAWAIDGARFEGAWRPTASGRFAWRFLDASGLPAAVQPEPLDVQLLADSAPAVSIPMPGRDTILSMSLKQPLILEARDDYGLRRLELIAYRVGASGDVAEPVTQGLDLGGTRAALARPLLDFSDWRLLPGDEVRYFARAVDNAPEGHEARSREYVLRVPDASELRRGAGEVLSDVSKKLEELAAEAERKAEETGDLQRAAAARRSGEQGAPGRPEESSEMGFGEKEELKKALEGQKEMSGEVDSLRAELEALQRTLEDAGQADPQLTNDLEELQKLLEQIAGEWLRERLEQLAEGLDDEDVRQANQALQGLAKDQENLRDRLEESLERFRRAAVDQDFRATRGEMDELARKERALADGLKEGDRPELRAEQQEELAKQAEELDPRMDRLGERLRQLGEEAAAREVEPARVQARRGREQMEEAGRQARSGQSRQAADQADQAAEQLEQAAEQLDRAQREMAEQKGRAALEALRRAGDDALALARRQSDLQQSMEGASTESLSDLQGDEASLVQGVRNVAQNLQASAEAVLASNQDMSVQIGRAMESMERTIQALEARRGATPTPSAAAERAVDGLNQLALLAMAGAERMTAAQQGQGQSGEEVTEQLEQLAQQQGEMVNRTGQLTPLQLGAEALREQLERLAEEQQSVADQLEDLSDQKSAEEEALGDLDALAAEAEALARTLSQGRLTPETRQREERLFHRLLDAGRSLQKEDDDVSDERESRTAGAFERGEVAPLDPSQLGALRYRMPGPDDLMKLPPAVRRMVIEYFERLNRGGGPER